MSITCIMICPTFYRRPFAFPILAGSQASSGFTRNREVQSLPCTYYGLTTMHAFIPHAMKTVAGGGNSNMLIEQVSGAGKNRLSYVAWTSVVTIRRC